MESTLLVNGLHECGTSEHVVLVRCETSSDCHHFMCNAHHLDDRACDSTCEQQMLSLQHVRMLHHAHHDIALTSRIEGH